MTEPQPTPLQHRYPDDATRCYGCGRSNPAGLHLESAWEGD